ncbi:MAG: DUF4407 domain-containing protein [Bacteroidales bacterium]|nr:DUF4407 domain-containing protein [Bacteroidales bacterium]
MKNDIFIGYRREQEFDLTNSICNRLKADGYSVFFDLDDANNYSIGTGDIEYQIRSRIDECTDFIIIIDQYSFDRNKAHERDWLQFELEYAHSQGKNIIPIFKGINKIELPEDIAFLREIRGIEYNDKHFTPFYEKLKKSLRSITDSKNKDQAEQTEQKSDDTQKERFSSKSYEAYNFGKHRGFTRGNRIREFFWHIAGADTDILRLCPTCYHIYESIGMMVCVTTLLALLTGGYAFYIVSESWLFSLCLAPMYAFIIFCSYKFIVATGENFRGYRIKSYFKVLINCLLALIIGLCISAPMELIMFSGKIDEYEVIMNTEKAQKLQQTLSTNKEQLETELNEIYMQQQEYENAVHKAQEALCEEDHGAGKSGKSGKGLVYVNLKRQVDIAEQAAKTFNDSALERRKQINDELIHIDSLMQQQNKQLRTINNTYDFITRYKAFQSLIANDTDAKMVAWSIRILFIMLSISPIVAKMLLDNNTYEKLTTEIEHFKLKQYEQEQLYNY